MTDALQPEPFMPGLDLSERLFREAVEPLLDRHAPHLELAAGLIGEGSEVLGLDTPRSMDHNWGARLMLFLEPTDLAEWGPRLDALLRQHLPLEVAGHSIWFHESELEAGTLVQGATAGDRRHGVTITTAPDWLRNQFGLDSLDELTPATWLTMPEQALLETTSGQIYRDDSGEISAVRERLAWYPDEIWRYRMAAQWQRIGQIEPFFGRCGEVGDDLGSQLVAMSLVRDLMKLAFLMERTYAPYSKWFGMAFQRLHLSKTIAPHLDAARYATAWPEREAGIVVATSALAEHHNSMGLTEWIDPKPRHFFNRPYRVLFAERFAEALHASIANPAVKALPPHLGGIDQYIDSTDALKSQSLHRAIRAWIGDSDG